MAQLVLIKHGECLWHSKNAFTGWIDVPLSGDGIVDAIKAGSRMSDIKIDIVVTSIQIRAIETAMIAFTQCKNNKTPVIIHYDEPIGEWVNANHDIMEKSIIPVFGTRNLNEQCELQVVIQEKIKVNEENKCFPWCYN